MFTRILLALGANLNMLSLSTVADFTVWGSAHATSTRAIHFRKVLQKLPEYGERILHFRNILEEVVETLFMKSLLKLKRLPGDAAALGAQATV